MRIRHVQILAVNARCHSLKRDEQRTDLDVDDPSQSWQEPRHKDRQHCTVNFLNVYGRLSCWSKELPLTCKGGVNHIIWMVGCTAARAAAIIKS